jgi:deoxyribose-phosphate aldolase
MQLTLEQLAGMIDQTLLKPYVSNQDLRLHCEEAAAHHFKTVAINNAVVPYAQILEGSGVLWTAVLSARECTWKPWFLKPLSDWKGAARWILLSNLVESENQTGFLEDEMCRIVEACSRRRYSQVILKTVIYGYEKRSFVKFALRGSYFYQDIYRIRYRRRNIGGCQTDEVLCRQCGSD